MTAVTFDTLKFARALQAQGQFTAEQSSSLVDSLGEVLASDLLAKSDLRETELRLEAKIADVKADLVKWLFGAVGVQTLVILGAVFALARAAH